MSESPLTPEEPHPLFKAAYELGFMDGRASTADEWQAFEERAIELELTWEDFKDDPKNASLLASVEKDGERVRPKLTAYECAAGSPIVPAIGLGNPNEASILLRTASEATVQVRAGLSEVDTLLGFSEEGARETARLLIKAADRVRDERAAGENKVEEAATEPPTILESVATDEMTSAEFTFVPAVFEPIETDEEQAAIDAQLALLPTLKTGDVLELPEEFGAERLRFVEFYPLEAVLTPVGGRKFEHERRLSTPMLRTLIHGGAKIVQGEV